jgi:hypothetical protein
MESKKLFYSKSKGHLVDFVLVELLAPKRPTIKVREFLFLTSNERKASSSHKLLCIIENAIAYVAVLKYRTIPRLNRFPFNTLSAERHLAQFRFIVPIASRITGFIGYIPWKQLASRRILGKVLGVLRRRRTLTISTRHFHQIVTKSGLFSALPARFLDPAVSQLP